MSFTSLPNDVIRHIISFCPNTLNVIKSLPQKKKNTLFDFDGLECIDLDHEEFNKNHHLIGIRTRNIYLRHKFVNNQLLQLKTDNYLRIVQMCPNIEIIEDSSGFFSDEVLVRIVQNCPLFTRITIWCHFDLTDVPFIEMARNSKNLTSLILHVDDDSKVSDIGLTSVLQGCSKIETLHIHENHFIDNTLYREISRLSSLLELDITNRIIITDEILIQIASGCKNLKKLSVLSNSLSNECLIEVGHLCPEITDLGLNLKFTNLISLIKIVEAFPNLLNFSCYGMTANENLRIMKKLQEMYPNLVIYPNKYFWVKN